MKMLLIGMTIVAVVLNVGAFIADKIVKKRIEKNAQKFKENEENY